MLVAKLTEVADAAVKTEFSLLTLTSLSQAEGSLPANTDAERKRRRSKAQRNEQVESLLRDEDKGQLPASVAQYTDPILNSREDFKCWLDKQSLQDLKVTARLVRVSKVFQHAFQSTETFQTRKEADGDADFKAKIAKSVERLKALFKSSMEGDNDSADLDPIFFPGPTGHEVDGVQPLLMVLLEAVANCVQLDFVESREETLNPSEETVNRSSPPKAVSGQKVVYGGTERRERRCDACVWKRGRYLVVMLDGSMHLTFEIKPGQRLGQSIVELRREAMDQCLSHSSKSLLHCLRFSQGTGIPSHATSVLGTLVYIEVVQLKLIDPGKTTSRVQLVSSGPLPLVSQDLFDRWYYSDQRYEKHVDEMRKLLFPESGTRVDQKDDVPLGFKALYALMSSSRRELIGPKWENVSPHLGPLLGTGTFGMVFFRKDDREQAIKVTRSGLRYYIKKEAAILSFLKKAEDRPASIPHLVSSGFLETTIGGVSSKLPAIAMKPVGQDIYPSLQNSDFWSTIDCILKDISCALQFLHSKGISHNDVSDRNILLVNEGSSGRHAVLVDFSVASQMYGKQTGFCGTPPFVHREVHQNYHWFPVPEYDKTSLGLTLIVLLARGVIPWNGLSDRGPSDTKAIVYETRIDAARSSLKKESGTNAFSQATARTIESLILLDEQAFLYKCGCSTTKCGNRQCSCRGHERRCSVLCKECYDEGERSFKCKNGDERHDILDLSDFHFNGALFERDD